MDYQNVAGLWGLNFVGRLGDWFVAAIQCTTTQYFVIHLWGFNLPVMVQ